MNSAPGLRFQVQGLLLVLLCGCIYLQGTDAKWRPSINSTWEIRPSFGQNFSVPCQGSSAFRTCSIYWLANGSFVEELYPDGAVREEEAREISHGPGRHHLLSRELVFHAFSKRDLRTTFRRWGPGAERVAAEYLRSLEAELQGCPGTGLMAHVAPPSETLKRRGRGSVVAVSCQSA
uniref:Uncharacterized protein n=1 Tax=Sphaerodactylus townsendi TaxID=933632 RepID=A0ACB8FF31_9SAUR